MRPQLDGRGMPRHFSTGRHEDRTMSSTGIPANIAPGELKTLLQADGELALLDVREEGVFARDHLFSAVCLPLSRLELLIDDLVPRRATPIVLCDGGEGLAERASRRLTEIGYLSVSVLAGGTDAWKVAGNVLYEGVNVPCKAFGEFVAATYQTPSISADELKAMMDSGNKPIILDSRPMTEYQQMNVPGAINVPGAELVYRLRDLAPSPDTLVVINCAGRTRSIVGAQSLINAGAPNRVVALKNGTMGWHLAGHELEHRSPRRHGALSYESLQWAQEAAERIATRFGVKSVDADTLATWRKERNERTLYLLDVRHPEEYEAGHIPGSRSAPGGQLVQAIDNYVATRGARLVLIDDTGVRATLTASWLIQMGWESVVVYSDGLIPGKLDRGRHQPTVLGLEDARAETLSPAELAAALESREAVVADLATSREFERTHLRGASFVIRSRMAEDLANLRHRGTLVLTSPDGVVARLAAAEAQEIWDGTVKVLRGGTIAWRADRQRITRGLDTLASTPDDVYRRPYERTDAVEDAMRAYLEWEVGLTDQIAADPEARFKKFP